MQVVAYDPFLTEEHARAIDVELASLPQVIAAADVLSLHVPLTEDTAGLLGERQIATMKAGAFLVNAARGGLVDEGALINALSTGRLGGAALDVYGQEPLPADHPLRKLDNIVLTPHLGASTAEAQQSVAVEISEAVRSALLDGDLSRAVNAPAIGGEQMKRLRPLLELSERLGRLAAALPGGRRGRASGSSLRRWAGESVAGAERERGDRRPQCGGRLIVGELRQCAAAGRGAGHRRGPDAAAVAPRLQ
jgi:hypothetical protein